ncbi:hypothetical protein [Amycolatopsis sp. NPDC059657]|uniref:hypothetical protein n=1 Tax=Amycolatopsis sp. NPDC059657 TaxID=3346899 RepID=UPI00366D2255
MGRKHWDWAQLGARAPEDWRRRARRDFPLRVDAVRTKLAPGVHINGNPFFWEFAYFVAIPRRGGRALLLGLALPLTLVGVSLGVAVAWDISVPLVCVAAFGLLLMMSFLVAQVRRRPYWQPGVVPMVLLSIVSAVPLMVAAQAAVAGYPRQSAGFAVFDWLTVQAAAMIPASVAGLVVWLPIAYAKYRRRADPCRSRSRSG